jgi:protein involved in polysaccharide export with SLBB domain
MSAMRAKFALIKMFALALVLVSINSTARGGRQDRRPDQAMSPIPELSAECNTESRMLSDGDHYRISACDVIEIRIEDAPELSTTSRVNADGTFRMPSLDRILAQHKTSDEVAAFIADKLRGGYLEDPKVSVVVRRYRWVFFVMGAVCQPGRYELASQPSLLTLIAAAGGLPERREGNAIIFRADRLKTVDRESELPTTCGRGYGRDIRVVKLLNGGLDQNPTLRPNDFVLIEFTESFYVLGEVVRGGIFQFEKGVTLSKAVSMAHGTSAGAEVCCVEIVREDPISHERRDIRVDLARIEKGEEADIPILANDIIIVPGVRTVTPLLFVDPPPRKSPGIDTDGSIVTSSRQEAPNTRLHRSQITRSFMEVW